MADTFPKGRDALVAAPAGMGAPEGAVGRAEGGETEDVAQNRGRIPSVALSHHQSVQPERRAQEEEAGNAAGVGGGHLRGHLRRPLRGRPGPQLASGTQGVGQLSAASETVSESPFESRWSALPSPSEAPADARA